MKAELIRGITVGDNPKRTATRIVKRTDGRFNGGLTRAMSIACTEVLDASRAATHAADKANANVMRGWVWGAELGARTCPSCLANHGTEHPIEEEAPIDHHQGRCTRIPLTKSWADLGFAGIEKPPSLLQDSQEWFDGLTPGTQREIMGPERLKPAHSRQSGTPSSRSAPPCKAWLCSSSASASSPPEQPDSLDSYAARRGKGFCYTNR